MAEPLTLWLDAFVDVPPTDAEAFRTFWSAVVGGPVSAARGDRGQFRSLLPEVGRAYLRVQELEGPARVHLDLVTGDPAGERPRLLALGAAAVASLPGVEIIRSPAGLVHCLVADDEDRPAEASGHWARSWPDGHRSRLAQVCVDVPPAAYDAELAYWTAVTGWPQKPSDRAEFTHLMAPEGVPLKLLVQRLERPDDRPGLHLDLGTDDIDAEVRRLLALGARDLGRRGEWHTLADPVVGLPFCVSPQQP